MALTDKFLQNNRYLMLALDHRGSFKKVVNPHNPEFVTNEQIVALKKEIIDSCLPYISGLLIDPQNGLAAYPKHTKPFLLPIEKSGYTDKMGERLIEIETTAAELAAQGASGVKILVYFNPNVPSAKTQLYASKRVWQECQAAHLPLFLEIRVYKPDTGDEISESERPSLVLSSLEMFMKEGINADIYKMEYPGDEASCGKITEILHGIPWIILTRGAGFDEFKGQLLEATRQGCVGFLAGRALWQDVANLQGEERAEFFKTVLPNRAKQIAEISEGKITSL